MPELAHLTRPKPKAITVDLGDGDELNITFDRNKITREWQQAGDETSGADGLAAALADVILGWDVTENGVPLAADADGIGRLSIPAQADLLRQIIENSTPTSAEGNSQNGPSPTPSSASTAPPATPPSGSETSPSPTASESPSTT